MKESIRQARNAIKWANELIHGDREHGVGQLGDKTYGFCCLGVGCDLLGVDYDAGDGNSKEFSDQVGLLNPFGKFVDKFTFFNESGLAYVNDQTNAGFKRIGKFLLSHPEKVFKPEVAAEIRRIL